MKKRTQKQLYLQTRLAGVFVLGAILVIGALFVLLKTPLFEKVDSETPPLSTSTSDDLEAPPSPFLKDEEIIIIEPKDASGAGEILPVEKVLFEYIEVTGGCGPHFEGECLNVRSGPGTDYEVVAQLRNHIVLKIGGKVERATSTWYKVVFDEWLRYPERLGDSDWYVHADYVEVLLDEGDRTIEEHGTATNTKWIVVDRSDQTLHAYEGETLFMHATISTGLELTPTPRGEFTIFKKTPSRYMQGPLPNLIDQQVYDLPGVPWNLYFTHGGAVIHGAYWHNSFGSRYSHGCVNLSPQDARTLYNWAELGTKVTVRD